MPRLANYALVSGWNLHVVTSQLRRTSVSSRTHLTQSGQASSAPKAATDRYPPAVVDAAITESKRPGTRCKSVLPIIAARGRQIPARGLVTGHDRKTAPSIGISRT